VKSSIAKKAVYLWPERCVLNDGIKDVFKKLLVMWRCSFVGLLLSAATPSLLSQETVSYDKPSDFRKRKCPEHIMWGERENEMYGSSVAIWYDLMLVGAYGDKSKEVNSGAVYVYWKFDDHHEDWQRISVLHPDDGESNDQYGYAVSLDYHTIVIGANKADGVGEDSGAAYLYQRKYKKDRHSEIEFIAKLLPEDGTGSAQDYFGSAVAVYGNITVIGAWGSASAGTLGGCAYIWTKYFGDEKEGEWIYTQQILPTDTMGYQRFGTSVATYQNFVAIGAPGALDSLGHEVGAVYLYQYRYDDSQYIGFSWQLFIKLTPSDGLHYDLFGHSVSLWKNTLLVGSPQSSHFPSSDSNQLLSQSGAVYSYAYTMNKKWELIDKILPQNMAENGHFGYSVAIYEGTAAIGSYNQQGKGSVAMYREVVRDNGGTLLHQEWKLNAIRHPKHEIPGDYYGSTVAVYNAYLAVGASGASLAWEEPSADPQKQVYSSGGVYLYFGQYEPPPSDHPSGASIIALTVSSLALISVGLVAVVVIYLEFRGKLDLRIEGTEYQLTDLESSHRSMAGMAEYALSYFKTKEESITSGGQSIGPVTRDPAQLSPFLPSPAPQSRARVIDTIDSSSSSMASISRHSVETVHPSPTSSTYGPSQRALDESIRMGVTRNKEFRSVQQ
jgi:hypothetical protein